MNDQGEPWIPPLGNGIKAAVEGLVPRKDSVASGDVIKADSDDAKGSIPGAASTLANGSEKEGKDSQSAAEKIVEETREASASKEKNEKDEKDLVNGLNGTHLNNGEKLEVPAVDTKPGEPVGDLVFDHPPTTPEITEAMKAVA